MDEHRHGEESDHAGVRFVPPGGGRVYEQRGFRGAIKVDNAESGGGQCFSEWTVDPGAEGPPPHLHRRHQEAFFVVEGTLTFTVGDATFEAEPGAFLYIPPGVVHSFSNPGQATARCVNAYVPGGIEGFFVEVGEAFARGEPDPAELGRLSAKYDVHFADGD